MGAVSREVNFTTGQVPSQEEWNTDLDTLFTLVSGNLNAENVDTTSVACMAVANTFTARQTFSGAYTTGVVLGNSYIWKDSTNGCFRTKHGSAPTSETDGNIIMESA